MMLKWKQRLRGTIALLTLILSTTFFFIPIFIVGLLKLLPNLRWRVACSRFIDGVISNWCDVNNTYIDKTQKIDWQIQEINPLDFNDWYLVIANHQSWLDIVILQRLFNRQIPMLKFFIKDQLKWVPLLGFAWWAMGSPFMKRYSKDYLAKKPHKKGQDLKATRKALNLFQETPSTLMNFIEGTRFTPNKKAEQQSPYQHLLKPRAGGLSYVLDLMDNKSPKILDVTIAYSHSKHSLWDFLCHRVNAISIHMRELPLPEHFLNANLNDNQDQQSAFREWLNEQWTEKDCLMEEMKNNFSRAKLNRQPL